MEHHAGLKRVSCVYEVESSEIADIWPLLIYKVVMAISEDSI